MKKIAILGAVLALSTSAIADDSSFYVKIGALGGVGHKLFDDEKTPGGKDQNKFGDFTFAGGAGVGYKIMENVRAELQGFYFGGPKFKYEVAAVPAVAANPAAVPAVVAVGKNTRKVEVTGAVVGLNAAVDVVSFGPAGLYVTGGAGISYLSVKDSVKFDVVNATDKDVTTEYDSKVRFSYNVGAGVTFAVSDMVAVDVGYSFVDLGKPAKEDTKGDTKVEWTGNNLRSHNGTIGVRFSL